MDAAPQTGARGDDPLGARPRPRRGSSSRWQRERRLRPARRGHAGGELLDRDPAAERDRGAAHGPRAQRHGPGRADPDAPDAGPQRALDPRHRPRRDRDPGGGREGAARGGDRRATSSAARRSSSGSGSGGASTASQIVEQYKRLGASCDYERERFTLDEDYVRAVYRVFVSPLREGADLPRQLHGQLGPGDAARRSPTSRSSTARSPTPCTRSTTRSRAPTRC